MRYLLILLGTFILISCGFKGSNPNYGTNLNFNLINTESGVIIKKILGKPKETIYVLNNLGQLWQYNGSLWTNLNTYSGLNENTQINDFSYCDNYIFATTNDNPSQFVIYNTQTNVWIYLTNLPPINTNNAIVSINYNNNPVESLAILIGLNPINNQNPPTTIKCDFNSVTSQVDNCLNYKFNNESNNNISSLYYESSLNSTYISINSNLYTDNNNFTSWQMQDLESYGNIFQISFNNQTKAPILATKSGVITVYPTNQVLYNIIANLSSNYLNSQIMAQDTASTIWVAPDFPSTLYALNIFNHLFSYSYTTSNNTYAPITSLFIVNQPPHSQVYIGDSLGQVFQH